MRLSLRTKLITVLVIGAAIREALAPFTGHPFDFEVWIRLGFYSLAGLDPYRIMPPVSGLSMPGSGDLPSIGYPPLWPFVLALIYKFYSVIGVDNRFLYYLLLKQPMVACDLLDAFLLYKIVKGISGQSNAFRAFSFYVLCPYTIIISSVWGMFDQVILSLVLLAILQFHKTGMSAASEAVGILLKAIPLIFLPVLAFAVKGRSRIYFYFSLSVGIVVIFSLLPYLFFPSWNILTLLQTGNSGVNKVGNSMNYWVVVDLLSIFSVLPTQSFPILLVLSYAWIPAVIIASVFCVRFLRKGVPNPRNLSVALLFVTIAFYLTRSQINEQYLIYFIGFGLIDYYVLASPLRKRLFHGVWIASLLYLIANNSFLVRFLDPISFTYRTLEESLTTGAIGDLRYGIMLATALAFSYFLVLYIRSLYFDLLAAGPARL